MWQIHKMVQNREFFRIFAAIIWLRTLRNIWEVDRCITSRSQWVMSLLLFIKHHLRAIIWTSLKALLNESTKKLLIEKSWAKIIEQCNVHLQLCASHIYLNQMWAMNILCTLKTFVIENHLAHGVHNRNVPLNKKIFEIKPKTEMMIENFRTSPPRRARIIEARCFAQLFS